MNNYSDPINPTNMNPESLKNKASSMLEEGKQKIAHAYEEGKEKVNGVVQHTKDATVDFIAEGKHKIAHVQDNVMKYNDELIELVKEKPLTALLVAGGLGYFLSMMLSKK